MVHVNYHPDKFDRMKVGPDFTTAAVQTMPVLQWCCIAATVPLLPSRPAGHLLSLCLLPVTQAIVRRYYDGDMHALDPFPNGSERDGTEKVAKKVAAATTTATARTSS